MGATFSRVEIGSKPQTDQSGEYSIEDREATAEELERVEPLTDEQFRDIAKSTEYKNSALVRELAKAGRGKSVALEIQAEDTEQAQQARQQEAVERIGNRREAELAVGRAHFNDPRYKRDAAYRFQVAQQIATSQKTHGQGGTHRLTVGNGEPGQVVNHQRSGPMRVQFDTQVTGPNKPEKPAPVKPQDSGPVDLYPYK